MVNNDKYEKSCLGIAWPKAKSMQLDVAGHFTAAAAAAATTTAAQQLEACLKRKIVCYKIQLQLWFFFLLLLLLLLLRGLMRQCNGPS